MSSVSRCQIDLPKGVVPDKKKLKAQEYTKQGGGYVAFLSDGVRSEYRIYFRENERGTWTVEIVPVTEQRRDITKTIPLNALRSLLEILWEAI